MKKFLLLVFSSLVLIIIIMGVYAYSLYQRPGVRYILNMSGYMEPSNFVKSEETLRVDGTQIPVMKYTRPQGPSDKWFILIHGFAPSAHEHPRINQMAASICDATGMSVLIPRVPAFFQENKDVQPIIDNIRTVYLALTKEFSGQYRAFGACLGGTFLLMALQDVPVDIYPEKILLFGPMNDGKWLQEKMNQNNQQLDFIVKLAITGNHDAFSSAEKKLIHKAMMSSSPGKTDTTKMKQILGTSLYNDISILNIDDSFFSDFRESIPPGSINQEARCRYFILHSHNDDIIPFSEGKSLFHYMKEQGKNVRFYGTETTGHTDSTVTVTGLYQEMKYLTNFFDSLFEGDVIPRTQ
ncbi:MAG: alpha/beta hydrolase family protein [Spirochaetota bacterium]